MFNVIIFIMIHQWFSNLLGKDEITILFLGQSNAGNRNNVSLLNTTYNYISKDYENVKYLEYSASISEYEGTTILGDYDRSIGAFGIELGMISELAPLFKQINLIKYFFGSTSLKEIGANDFNPNSTNEMYERGVHKGDGSGFCEQVVNANNLNVDIVVWVQGEEDAVISSETYESDLGILKAALKSDFNNNIIFVYNQLHTLFYFFDDTEHSEPGKTQVRAGQSAFNDNDRFKMIVIDDIPIGDPSNVHFDANASAEIGIRFGTYLKTKL